LDKNSADFAARHQRMHLRGAVSAMDLNPKA